MPSWRVKEIDKEIEKVTGGKFTLHDSAEKRVRGREKDTRRSNLSSVKPWIS